MHKKKIFAGPSIRRLPSYLYIVKAAFAQGEEYISGTVIADELKLEAIQVRKDLSLTGIIGKPKRGYAIKELITSIESFLGWNIEKYAALIGAGCLDLKNMDLKLNLLLITTHQKLETLYMELKFMILTKQKS